MADLNNNTHIDTLELDPADGQQYILELRDRLLDLLSSAQTIQEVEDKLRRLYPKSELIDKAIGHVANKQNDYTHKNQPTPSIIVALRNVIAKVSKLVRDGVIGNKSENELSKYKIALIQYIIDDVLKLAGEFVKRQRGFIITRSDIRTAMHADKDLLDMFLSDDKSVFIAQEHPLLAKINCSDKSGHFDASQRPTTT